MISEHFSITDKFYVYPIRNIQGILKMSKLSDNMQIFMEEVFMKDNVIT